MKIELTRGLVAEIDDDDWEVIKGYRWTSHIVKTTLTQYAIAFWQVDGQKFHVLMHRLLLGLTDPKIVVDHRDGNGLNNRRSNIRVCTHAENMRNCKIRSHSGSGIKNVAYESTGYGYRKWRGCVRANKVAHRKWFDSAAEAETWVKSMRDRLHGEFSYKPEQDSRK